MLIAPGIAVRLNRFSGDEDPAFNIRYGVKVPHAGVKVRVLTQNGTSMRIKIS